MIESKPCFSISLNNNWEIRNSTREPIKVDVPCTIFEVLKDKGLILDPFNGMNEQEVNWVFLEEWHFCKEFHLSKEILLYNHLTLIFNGLDTVTSIFLNEHWLGSTRNMFQRYEFDIRPFIHEGKNHLKLLFHSPVKFVANSISKEGIKLNTGSAGIHGAPYLRKSQYSFGWDWGPQLPDIGIWKPVEILAWDNVKIETLHIKHKIDFSKNSLAENSESSDLNRKAVAAEVTIEIELNEKSHLEYMEDLEIDATIILDAEVIANQSHKLESLNSSVKFQIKDPKLWWTADLGNQILYDLEIVLRKRTSKAVIDHQQLKFGIRELHLIRKSDRWGESFYFLLNQIPVFAKGANWIPIDSFLPRGKKLGLYEMNLHTAIEANMNFLRVWGGGIYEDDRFYDLCDHLGILVWQDFPFACAIYPDKEEFIKNVEAEAVQNIKRLRNHASLALWCGNNEIEWLWPLLAFQSRLIGKKVHRKYKEGYMNLFEQLLPELIRKHDPSRFYWPSSPSNGLESGKGFKGSFLNLLKSNQASRGDSHFWKVWHQSAPFSALKKFNSRFMSEYGFESFPSMRTIRSFCPEEELHFFSAIMENHQKNPAGNAKILKYMKRRFKIPRAFEKQVILSQITHGEALEYGIEHWRRHRNDFECMGSLYWQLNDCWPVASWASVDYFGRWKAAHYFVKRSYSPVLISINESNKKVEVWGTNDLPHSVDIKVEWSIYDFHGNVKYQNKVESVLEPCKSGEIDQIRLNHFNILRRKLKHHVIFFSSQIMREGKNIDKVYGFRLFKDPKSFPLTNPNLEFDLIPQGLIKRTDQEYAKFQVNITAQSLALYVHFDVEDYDFIASDNFFSLRAQELRSITLAIPTKDLPLNIPLDHVNSRLKLRSLIDLV